MQASTSLTTSAAQASFLKLPRELRDIIYAHVLVDEQCIGLRASGYHPLSSQFLRTNRTIHDDATELLYADNRFDFTDCYSYNLASFLNQIGPQNSKYIRYVRIDFPTFQHLDSGDVTLTEDNCRVLEMLRNYCGDLRMLTLSRPSADQMERWLDSLEHPKLVIGALNLVGACFKVISTSREKDSGATCQRSQQFEPNSSCAFATSPSLPSSDQDGSSSLLSIVVEVYEEGPSDDIRRKMQTHGWMLDIAETPKEDEEDMRYSDFDDRGWSSSGGSDDENDNYDIDDNSDVWRRAGDWVHIQWCKARTVCMKGKKRESRAMSGREAPYTTANGPPRYSRIQGVGVARGSEP